MLEGGEEPDNMTKTGTDGGIPAPREAARRISHGSQHAWTAVDHGSQRYGPKGRRSGGGQVEATIGRPQGAGGPRAAALRSEEAA